MEDSDLLMKILDTLDCAYTGSAEPPPHFEAAIGVPGPTGVSVERIDGWRRELVAKVTGALTLGVVLRSRREAMGIDVDDLGREARWAPARIEELEAGKLDLSHIEPAVMARLLAALRIGTVAAIEHPLRELARQHLAVYERNVPVYGRSRRDVSAVDRRRDLTGGVMPVDTSATERAADRYLAAVQAALDDRPT